MPIPVLITKVVTPAWREEILSRKRLTALFDDLLDRKLIILSAPAGYGKTSLLLDVAHHNELPFCWYTLDTLDQEVDRFLAHFIASISRRFPAFGEQSLAALQGMSQGNINVEEMGVVIINEIYHAIREHFVIVLDDYQMVDENPVINKFINHFIQNVDQNCHLAITSRSTLPLPDLSLMVGRSLVGGLGLPELAFQPDEIQALMLKNYQQVIPDAIAVELAQRTEGWITGLLLSAQSMWQGMVNQLRLARVSGVDLYDYLMEQVLDQQPQVLRDFLLQTSFLDELNSDLCAVLFGEPPPGYTWRGLLDNVLRHNLFVLPVGESGEWLHYHRLFSDFLQAQYAREQPARANALLRRLVEVYAGREEWEKAYSFCLRLADPEATADLIEKAGESMVVNGRITLLRSWLEALPVNLVHERPILLARYGIVLATQKETTRGLQLLDQSVELFRAAEDQAHLAGSLVWRALAHFLRAEYSQALADVREVFSLTSALPPDDRLAAFQAEAHRIGGQCYRMLGDMPAASQGLKNALEIFKRLGDPSGINRVLLLLGLLNLDTGYFKAAMVCYQQVLDYYQKRQDAFSSSSVLNDIAYLHYLKGEYMEAFATFNDSLVKARQSGNARVEGLVLIGLGDVFADLAEYSEAIRAYHQGRLIVESIKEASLLIYVNLAKAAVARAQSDFPLAHKHLNSARAIIEETKTEYSRGLYLLQAGLLAMAEHDYPQAANTLSEAHQAFLSGEQRVDEIRSSCLLATAWYELDRTQEAGECLAQAAQLAAVLDGRNILIQAARQVKATLTRMASADEIGVPAIRLLDEVAAFEADLPRLKKKLRAQETIVFIAPPRLCIQAFGQIQVTLNERPVTGADWQVTVTRDLLFLILGNRSGWSKEKIGVYLWPESSLSQLNQRFKNTIYRLRRALDQDVIQYTDGIYSFNRNIDYEYDAEQFEEHLSAAKDALNVEDQVSAFQAAVQLYQGDYLPGMDGEWVIMERERLRQLFLRAGMRLAELYADTRRYANAQAMCNRLIQEDPCLEEAYRLAMNLYAWEGNRGAIAQLYKGLRQGLLEYADADPSPQTESLYKSLIS